MNAQMKKLEKVINTPAMFDLVNAYFLQRAFTEVTREQVNVIYAAILQDIPAYADPKYTDSRQAERIADVNNLYLCSDDAVCAAIYAEADKRLRAANFKSDDMPFDFCPALVAENELNLIENQIINVSGKPMRVTVNDLLCSKDGSAKRKQWLDLVIKAVMALPNFQLVKLERKGA